MCDEYYIADIACWPWVRLHERLAQPLDEFPNVQRWFEVVGARPAVESGCNVGSEWWGSRKLDDKSRKNQFNQTAVSIEEQADEARQRDS